MSEKYGNLRIYHATARLDEKPCREADEITMRYDKRNMKIGNLVSYYLCDQERSLCVLRGECDCLDRCVYGQRYLEMRAAYERERGGH